MFQTKLWLLFIVLFTCVAGNAQNIETDSLKKQLDITPEYNKRVHVLESLSYAYLASYPDTAMQYALQGLRLAQDKNYQNGEAICINALGNVYFHIGDNARALEMYLKYLQLKEELHDVNKLSIAYYNIAGAYTEEKDYKHALFYLFKAKQADEKAKDSSAILYDLYSLASNYLRMQKTDSALLYNERCYAFAKKLNDKNMIGAVLNNFGEIYFALGNFQKAAAFYNLSIPFVKAVTDNEVLTSNYFGLAKVYKQNNREDSTIYYARKALVIASNAPFFKQVFEISSFLSDFFSARKRFDSAFFYQHISITTKDSLFNIEEVRKVQNLRVEELQRQQAIETAKVKYQDKIKMLFAIFTCLIFIIIALVLWRNNKQKQQANILLRQQKEKIESTLSELKSTQAQLIQSEKMASLGELTAGIAHEIQNPLNFVNNFAEVNNDLIEEINNENDIHEVRAIANYIKQNNEKITYHGNRADSIVKGMLQHSRKNTGTREPANINSLCDEYLRLSYHGLRAKDKNFNADFKTDLDKGIGKINIVPQDIGRVLLNLFNNAFYAVSEKQKTADETYKPLVTVATKSPSPFMKKGWVEVSITDNGNGIPPDIIEKIFQPFFTTKPSGQGTGLGLSLAYDIITKEHNGTIKAESKQGEGSKFIIELPVN